MWGNHDSTALLFSWVIPGRHRSTCWHLLLWQCDFVNLTDLGNTSGLNAWGFGELQDLQTFLSPHTVPNIFLRHQHWWYSRWLVRGFCWRSLGVRNALPYPPHRQDVPCVLCWGEPWNSALLLFLEFLPSVFRSSVPEVLKPLPFLDFFLRNALPVWAYSRYTNVQFALAGLLDSPVFLYLVLWYTLRNLMDSRVQRYLEVSVSSHLSHPKLSKEHRE